MKFGRKILSQPPFIAWALFFVFLFIFFLTSRKHLWDRIFPIILFFKKVVLSSFCRPEVSQKLLLRGPALIVFFKCVLSLRNVSEVTSLRSRTCFFFFVKCILSSSIVQKWLLRDKCIFCLCKISSIVFLLSRILKSRSATKVALYKSMLQLNIFNKKITQHKWEIL